MLASAMRRSLRAATLATLLLLLAIPAAAHQEPYSYVDVRITEHGLTGTAIAHRVDLAHEAGIEPADSLLDQRFAAARIARLHEVLSSHLHLLADGRPVSTEWGAFEILRDRRSLSFAWQASLPRKPGELRVLGPLFPYDPPHETYLNVYEDGALRSQELLDRSKREVTYWSGTRQGTLAVVRAFVAQGIHHIFVGPDHILFIIGLLLLGGGVRRLLKIVTAFTVAHSVTLALAALKILNPPSRVIEPAIALSIIYVGVETLLALNRERDWRAWIAFGFGFVHGFGFAGVLQEFGLPPGALGWSLASFNVGVEIGQACVVLAVAPVLSILGSHRPALARRVVTVGSALIIAAGSYWFVQRVFFTA